MNLKTTITDKSQLPPYALSSSAAQVFYKQLTFYYEIGFRIRERKERKMQR